MPDILQSLVSDPRVNAISLVLAMIGVILTIVFYLRSTNVKDPCYSIHNETIITPKLAKKNPIKVTFFDRPVENLLLTHVAFWNAGRATITHSDMTEIDPLRIIATDGEILSANLVIENKIANGFNVIINQEDRSIRVDFDFIDHMNGVVVAIYHTGQSDDAIQIIGTIKGATNLHNIDKSTNAVIDLVDKIVSFLTIPFRLMPK